MNPAVARRGNFFAGAVGYITHDVGKNSAERVAFTGVINMRTSDPEKAAKVMAWTTLHAAELKEAAGFKNTGRKTQGPVYHFTLNWEPGTEPARNHMVETGQSALKALGYEEHEAVYAVHTDKDHRHMHIVVNRIHPVTGKAHNPENDQRILQRWAYEYEKGQGNVICLDRAIKYEKDPQLRAEYERRLAQEIETGNERESKPRPQWEAEKEATQQRPTEYQQLKGKFAERVRTLSKDGRTMASRQAQEWADLKSKHEVQRAALMDKQTQAFQHRRTFGEVAKRAAYSWETYQADRNALRKRQALQLEAYRASLKAKDVPAVAAFEQSRKAAWREFFKLDTAKARGRLEPALRVVASTAVGHHGPDYRDHLARLFTHYASASERKTAFAVTLRLERSELGKSLKAAHAPGVAQFKERQKAELVALRQRFDTARQERKTRVQAVGRARESAKQERQQLSSQQRAKAAALKAKQSEESRNLQKAWADLSKERSTAWEGYKAKRDGQAKSRAPSQGQSQARESDSLERGTLDSYAASRAITSTETGRDRGDGQPDPSRSRSIPRKGPPS